MFAINNPNLVIQELEDEDNDDILRRDDLLEDDDEYIQRNMTSNLAIPKTDLTKEKETITSSSSTSKEELESSKDESQSEFNSTQSNFGNQLLKIRKERARGISQKKIRKHSCFKNPTNFKRYSNILTPSHRLSKFSKASRLKYRKFSRNSSGSMIKITRSEARPKKSQIFPKRKRSFTKKSESLISVKFTKRYSYEKVLVKLNVKRGIKKKMTKLRLRKKSQFQIMFNNLKSIVKKEEVGMKEKATPLFKHRESSIPSSILAKSILLHKQGDVRRDKRYTINVLSEEREKYSNIGILHGDSSSKSISRETGSKEAKDNRYSIYSQNSGTTFKTLHAKRISGFNSAGRADIEIINEDIELLPLKNLSIARNGSNMTKKQSSKKMKNSPNKQSEGSLMSLSRNHMKHMPSSDTNSKNISLNNNYIYRSNLNNILTNPKIFASSLSKKPKIRLKNLKNRPKPQPSPLNPQNTLRSRNIQSPVSITKRIEYPVEKSIPLVKKKCSRKHRRKLANKTFSLGSKGGFDRVIFRDMGSFGEGFRQAVGQEEKTSKMIKKYSKGREVKVKRKNNGTFNKWCKNFIFMPNAAIKPKNATTISPSFGEGDFSKRPFSPNVNDLRGKKLIDFTNSTNLKRQRLLSPKFGYFSQIKDRIRQHKEKKKMAKTLTTKIGIKNPISSLKFPKGASKRSINIIS